MGGLAIVGILFGIFVVGCAVCALAACMLSSQISREEERAGKWEGGLEHES